MSEGNINFGKKAAVAFGFGGSKLSEDQIGILKIVSQTKDFKPEERNKPTVKSLLSLGCLEKNGLGIRLTKAGKQALRRVQLAKDEEQIFAAQHQDRIAIETSNESKARNIEGAQSSCALARNAHAEPKAQPKVNRQENPLTALAARKRADGSPLISASQLQAGERFRKDFERGQLSPMMGINWDRLGNSGSAGSSGKGQGQAGRCDVSDSALAARKRFSHAASYVGEELSGILIDVCCFLKGLEAVERDRNWPARSAKQILSLALDRLARHYGLSDRTEGPLSNVIRHWGAEGYRPDL